MSLFIAIILNITATIFSYTNLLVYQNGLRPPGTVLVKDSLYIDQFEISNANWKEYIRNSLLNHPDSSVDLYPDSTVTLSIRNIGKISMEEYFNETRFDDYPVVGINYEQALKFCEWRTKIVNQLIRQAKNLPYNSVQYQLPTAAEWELAALGNKPDHLSQYGQDTYYSNSEVSHRSFNCYYPDMNGPNFIRACKDTVNEIKPNSLGIYNMIGNVCEMVAEKGVAKGGHYEAQLKYCTIQETYSFKTPNKWLGFRCVCFVTKKPVKKKNVKN